MTLLHPVLKLRLDHRLDQRSTEGKLSNDILYTLSVDFSTSSVL